MLLNAFFWSINTSPKKSSSFNMSPTSAIIFIKCRNRYYMKSNIRDQGNINNTLVIIFLIRSWLNKTPSDGTCMGDPPGGFCDVGCCCCLFFPSLEVFHFIACWRHPSPFRELSPGFYTHFSPARVIRDTFILTFLFTANAAVLSGRFFTLHSFVCDSDTAGIPHPGSSSVPALTQLSRPADAWTSTIDVWITRPLIYQLRQWATKYRAKIELLNMFRLLKVIWKDYKNTLNKTWCTA